MSYYKTSNGLNRRFKFELIVDIPRLHSPLQ